jgi:hypothetical protein
MSIANSTIYGNDAHVTGNGDGEAVVDIGAYEYGQETGRQKAMPWILFLLLNE